MKKNHFIYLLLAWIWLEGCTTVAPKSPATTPTSSASSLLLATAAPTQVLPELIKLERTGTLAGNLSLLGQLWAEESQVIDGRGTVAVADDYHWRGRAAVLDRYVVAVFPNPPPPLELPAHLAIQVKDNQATIQNGVDRWRFVWQAGRWWIAELAYNRPTEAK